MECARANHHDADAIMRAHEQTFYESKLVDTCATHGQLLSALFFFNISARADGDCRGPAPISKASTKQKNASRRDLSDATLRLDLAPWALAVGMRRNSCQK